MVACSCHYKVYRRLRSAGLQFQASQGKNAVRLISTEKNLGVLACSYHPRDGRKFKIGSWSTLAWAKCKTLSPK
jgi:hypothetical protein